MICIAGKNEIAVNALIYIHENYPNEELVVVANRTDSGIPDWQPSLKFEAQNRNLPILELKDLYGIRDLLFLSLEFDQIIKPKLFATKRLYNVHFSMLPSYKGMFTAVLPILYGEEFTGVTLHRIDRGIDTGEIISQERIPISLDMNSRDLYQAFLDKSFALFKANLPSLLNGTETSQKQPCEGASYYSRTTIDFSNIKINFQQCAYQVHNFIRAFSFRDYQLVSYKGWEIAKSEMTNVASVFKPGTIFEETDEYFEISTIDYNIRLFKDYYLKFIKLVEKNDLDGIKNMISFIDDVNCRNKKGWNAIIIAAYNGYLDLFEYLLQNGADVNSENFKGTTVLMYAKSYAEISGDLKMIERLIKLGVGIDKKDWKGLSVLDYLDPNNQHFNSINKVLNNG